MNLRLATFNLWGRPLWSQVADLCRDEQLDLVCLQEVDRHYRARSDWEDVAHRAAEALGWSYFFAPTVMLPGQERPREYGNAILTRLQVHTRRAHPLAPEVVWTVPEDSLTEPRILLEVVVGAPSGGLLRVFCTHLADVTEPTEEWVALRQVEDLLRVIGDPAWADVPVVLAGDLNARVGSRTLTELEQALTLVPMDGATFDHVLVAGLRPAEARLLPAGASDHQPVLCVLDDRF
jgi:endonuclease/exonuclease/phosphatase family metal-dependent hydrolase